MTAIQFCSSIPASLHTVHVKAYACSIHVKSGSEENGAEGGRGRKRKKVKVTHPSDVFVLGFLEVKATKKGIGRAICVSVTE